MILCSSRILAVMFASTLAIAAGSARADEGNQKDEGQPAHPWTGFYFGANGGLGQSFDGKDAGGFIGVPRIADSSSAFSGADTGYGVQRGPFAAGVEDEINKALAISKPK